MNKLIEKITKDSKNLLNIYFTAGFPKINDTTKILKLLEKAGADIVEIGIPFSDPLADGPTIQKSSSVALANGMNIFLLFQQLEKLNNSIKIPIILMGYLNPILQFGIKNFCEHCKKFGVSGLIIPDLPLHEFKSKYKSIFDKNNISNICLITPKTSEKRIYEIDKLSSGFIYAVSSSSTTGTKNLKKESNVFFEQLSKMNLQNPVLIGFNIKDKATFTNACNYANGAIIGSAFINKIADCNDLEKEIFDFVKSIKN